jgi:fluoride ion exporter CrcB/FEX
MSVQDKGEDKKMSLPTTSEQRSSSKRRNVLKKTLTVGGITAAFTTWKTPMVESVILPAHAQTTTAEQRLVAEIII